MKNKNKARTITILFIIGVIMILLPLIDNVETISDLFKKQILINSLTEFFLMFIGITILIIIMFVMLYLMDKKEKEGKSNEKI